MDRIWANRLEAGTKQWSEVPETRRNSVDIILRQDVANGTINEDRYKEITGKPY